MQNDWPFDQPPNCAVISVREIVQDGEPVLLVSHDLHDHGWQFLREARPGHAVLVSFAEMVRRDPGLRDLADLPPGWTASRKSANDAWLRERVE
jgi:hypothetical protein